MGRILDLCGEIAAAAEEGEDGLVLPPDVSERLLEEWHEDEIDDALGLVHDSLLQGELVEAADSLSARLVELLGEHGSAEAFARAQVEGARLTLEDVGHLARRLARLEEVLGAYRDDTPPDRRGFDQLRRRLADLGIEDEMWGEDGEPPEAGASETDDDEER